VDSIISIQNQAKGRVSGMKNMTKEMVHSDIKEKK
jgi:hypothetical protein